MTSPNRSQRVRVRPTTRDRGSGAVATVPPTAAAVASGPPPAFRPAVPRRLSDSFSVLTYRNYRLLWLGNLVSNTGDQMDNISFNWLVYTLSDSAIWLGVVNLCRAAPILIFTLLGGVAADRIERRRMM